MTLPLGREVGAHRKQSTTANLYITMPVRRPHYAWCNGSHTQQQYTVTLQHTLCALRPNLLSLFSVSPACAHFRIEACTDKHTTRYHLLLHV
jgi:hypothetical protein